MLGLLGIGVTLLLGVAMRIGTAAGAVMYAFMYAAVIPLENNPIVDDHLIGVIVMVVLGLAAAGTTWGLGRQWRRIGLVEKNPVLK
jgi:thiosulfate dehydrogenase [quinone] large subunit